MKNTICFFLHRSSNQGVTQVRTQRQEAHWLKSDTDPLQPLPTLRQAMLPEQKD